jgi:hypothetical protein
LSRACSTNEEDCIYGFGGTARRKEEDNIKMDLRGIGLGGMDWILLVQDRDQCRDVVNTAMTQQKKIGELLST